MKMFFAQIEEEVQQFVKAFGSGHLYRGQADFYLDDDGRVSMPTSFARKGCIPPLMLKWSHYANELLRVLGGGHGHNFPIEIAQALLQHYGWRSFFIDLTSSPGVAAWFAANRFEQKKSICVAEDCFEQGLIFACDQARYELNSTDGYLFAIDSSRLQSEASKVIDLTQEIPADFRSRFSAQQALLFGPCEALPPEAVVGCLKAPARVLASFAESHGLKNTADLFPPRQEDAFLAGFLSVPFVKRGSLDEQFDAFARELELPEYDFSFRKHQGSRVAFFSPVCVSRNLSFGLGPGEVCIAQVPDDILYGVANGLPEDIGNLISAMGDAKLLVIEASGILRHIETMDGSVYSKGLALRKLPDDMFEVSEFAVDHPGSRIAGAGLEMGFHYRLSEGHFVRVPSNNDCPCNNPFKHELHLRMLKLVNDFVLNGKLIRNQAGFELAYSD